MATLEKAISIALCAHQGQKDQAGAPYILHPLRVMLKMDSEEEMMAAVLHDTIEDTAWTLEDLKQEGFPMELLEVLDQVTRRTGEPYEEFIVRAQVNPMARKIKLADLEDNLDCTRIRQVTEPDLARIKRYHAAWWSLKI
jgi:(p)ppGpp synthase/HD superfamily hydrolase